MSPITTHILDISQGAPASGVPVLLEFLEFEQKWDVIGEGITDSDGRSRDLLPENFSLKKGVYRLTFKTEDYFNTIQVKGFYPVVQVIFEIRDQTSHYHVPLLLSPYGYSTYRGS
ncbi:MAG: hydroxyisourate hydrolase [Candidatus Eremiobacteraeota bacterium]|nr:hydroxyisourate hydrolase [Candidatus Eremiobacteraeota bacterium]